MTTIVPGLVVPRALHDAMMDHVTAQHPREACGVLAGPAATRRPERHVRVSNVAEQPTLNYQMDPGEQLVLWRLMDQMGDTPLVIYHSHTASDAVPSAVDIQHATEPDAVHVIVSTSHAQVRAWRIVGDTATETAYTVTPGRSVPSSPYGPGGQQ